MILVDAHVHFYDCFDLTVFLDSALSNFQTAAEKLGCHSKFMAVLFFTEGKRENGFQRIARLVEGGQRQKRDPVRSWTFHRTKENISILGRHNGKQGIFLIAGRQIVTAENLEVLALGAEDGLKSGGTLAETLQTVKEAGAIPVIPWGTGKWLGRRGRILRKILEENGDPCLFLGDNGGRPRFWRHPSHFILAEKKGIRVLPGSDPLPFETECLRPGSFGFSLQGSIDPQQPAKELKRLLLDPATPIHSYGELERPFRFFQNQMAMQILKRKNQQKLRATENLR